MMNIINQFLLNVKHFSGLLLPITVAVVWEFMSRQGDAYTYIFVPLSQIYSGFVELIQSGELLINLVATLQTTVIGLVIGGFAGLFVGGLMAVSPLANKLIGPLYHTLRQVPLLGLIPLIALWFGNDLFSKILIVSLAAFYPIVLNTFEGMRGVEHKYVEVASVLKFNRLQLLIHVLLPAATPSIMTGLMHALAFAWVSTVGSELLFSTGPGVGGLMLMAQESSRMDIVIVAVVSIGLTGLLMNASLSHLRQYLLRWRSVR
ncbi:ABC transporter permease [Methylotenera sp.]|uniref:ABC transporter permease n=1 Tax=Methylotenera sp. TaxID=2051956 RepID=UPI002ED961C1